MSDKKYKSVSEILTTVIKHPLVNILLVFSVIFMAFIMQQARNVASLENIAIALSFVLLTVFITQTILAQSLKIHRQEYLDDKISDLKNIIVGSNLSWLVNEKYVSAVEAESETTWIFSPFMMNDVQLNENIDTLTANLKKGCRYIFFTADRPRNHKAFADFKRRIKFENGQVQVYFIPASDFLFVTDMMVFGVGGERERAIEKLPVVESQFHMEMDKLHTDRIIGIGRMFMERYNAHVEK
ncbi:MAG: hypothetical protein CMF60_00625 [Magnetococcales bacterium]|nr:hypothetical protein [Magnetococcales bacterium]MEC8066798.1 hypothetical protein [Pseudomonadota bacterium]|tara:strand:- start:4804 stop:5526 length:723 start_codon:yes stop_codon:yes gene_type:complete